MMDNYKVITLSINDPLEQICRDITSFRPDALVGYASGVALLAQEQIAGKFRRIIQHAQ